MNGDITGTVSNEGVAKIQDNIMDIIINPILSLATVIAFALFLYGITKFLINRSTSPDETAKGKKHMMYGILGLFILLSIWSLLIFIGKMFESKIWFVS